MSCDTPVRVEEQDVVVEAAAYASGDTFGEKIAFNGALREVFSHGALLATITLTALNTTTFAFDVLFYKADFAGSTDNDPYDVSAPDWEEKLIGHVSVATTDWITTTSHAVATLNGIGMALTSDATGTLYAQMIARGAVTPGSTNDYRLKIGVVKS